MAVLQLLNTQMPQKDHITVLRKSLHFKILFLRYVIVILFPYNLWYFKFGLLTVMLFFCLSTKLLFRFGFSGLVRFYASGDGGISEI